MQIFLDRLRLELHLHRLQAGEGEDRIIQILPPIAVEPAPAASELARQKSADQLRAIAQHARRQARDLQHFEAKAQGFRRLSFAAARPTRLCRIGALRSRSPCGRVRDRRSPADLVRLQKSQPGSDRGPFVSVEKSLRL